MSNAQLIALRDTLEQAHRALVERDMSDSERRSIAAFVQLQYLLLDRHMQAVA